MKSGYQKALKVISIIIIVIAALTLIGGLASGAFGILMGAAASDPNATVELSETVDFGMGAMTQQSAMALGAGLTLGAAFFLLIDGVVTLIIGILGVRGANDPNKIGPFRVFAIIGLVLSIIAFILLFFQQNDASTWISGVIGIVETAVCVWLAQKIRAQVR